MKRRVVLMPMAVAVILSVAVERVDAPKQSARRGATRVPGRAPRPAQR